MFDLDVVLMRSLWGNRYDFDSRRRQDLKSINLSIYLIMHIYNALFIKMETRGKGEKCVQAFSEHDLHTQEGHGLRSLINAEND